MKERLRRSSLWARGLIGAALGVVLAVVLSGAVIWGFFTKAAERQFDSQFDDYLKAMTAAVGGGPRYGQSFANHLGVGRAPPGADPSRLPFDPRLGQAYGGIYWEARRVLAHDDGEEELVFRSVSAWDIRLDPPEPPLELGETRRYDLSSRPRAGVALRGVGRRVLVGRTGDEWILLAAAEKTSLAQTRRAFAPSLALSLSFLAAALVAAAAFQVRFMLGPFGSFRRSIAEYRAGRATRIEGVYPAEVAPLVEDLNGLLDRNERLIAQGRRRAADLAHEMKTPVAVLRNELEALAGARATVAAGDEEPSGPPEDFAPAFEALAQIERQTRRQLARARVGAIQGARTPLRPAAERLRRALQRLHRAPLTIRLDIPEDLVFRGDEEDLEELLGELMNNARLWARGEVRVTAEAVEADGLLRLMVEDDGPGAAPEDHARMLSPGGRLDSRRPGSGIGLTMVADLVEAYGGGLTLGRAETGGLRVSLLLPGERAP